MAEQGARTRRRLSWRGKLLLAAGSVVAFLCLLEFALSIVGYEGSEERCPYERFRARKPRGTVRIVVVGGSAAAGYPFNPRGGPVAYLREILRDVAQGQPAEVLNCGVNSLTSEGVLTLVRKLLDYRPDCLIVYSGHNEFFNLPGINFQVAEWDPLEPSWWRRTRTCKILQDMALLLRGGPQDDPASRVTRAERAVAGTLGSPKDYRPGMLAPPCETRLREIVKLANERGVAIVLSTLASNIRDVPPPMPAHKQGLTQQELAAWLAAYGEGRKLAGEAKHEAALAAFAKAAAIDADQADLVYDQARCQYALGNFAEARKLFIAARDRDYMPMRATSPINDAVRRLAQSSGATLADAEAAFADASPGGIPGDELFCDHVHLNPAGARLLAECWARAIERGGLLGAKAGWDWARLRSGEAYDQALGLTPKYLAIGYLTIGIQCAMAEAGGRLVEGYRRPQFVEHARERGSRLMATALALDPQVAHGLRGVSDPYTLCYLAEAYVRLGQAGEAVEICQEVVDEAPRFALAYRCLETACSAAGDAPGASAARGRLAAIESACGGGGRPGKANGQKESKP